MVDAVEAHSFDPLDHLFWRNSDLDFSHVDALLDTLTAAPNRPGLVRGNDASDLETLALLAREPEIRHLAQGRRMVRKLWDACQIPDFRKLTDDTHARLCARVFGHIARDGALPTDWLAGQIGALARADGDIDTLMQRLSGVRVWSYIAARTDWVKDAAHWQGRAREVEDLLSDALHERLTSRFVDRRAAHLMRRLEARRGPGPALRRHQARRGGGGRPLRSAASPGSASCPTRPPRARNASWCCAPPAERCARRCRAASPCWRPLRTPPSTCDDDQKILWDSAPVGRLVAGSDRAASGRARAGQRVPRRRAARAAACAAAALSGQTASATTWPRCSRRSMPPTACPAARGLLHRLGESLGLILNDDRETVSPELRGRLRAVGVRTGRLALFLPALLKPRPAAMRARLWALQHGVALPALPAPGIVSVAADPRLAAGFAAAIGWIDAGPVRLRLDIAERVAGELGWAARAGAVALPGRAGVPPVDQGGAAAGGAAPPRLPHRARRRAGAGRSSARRRPPCWCRCAGAAPAPPRCGSPKPKAARHRAPSRHWPR